MSAESGSSPWFVLALCILISVLAQVFLKLGVVQIHGVRLGAEPPSVLVGRLVTSGWLWLGVLTYGAGTLLWLGVLSEFKFHEANLYFSVNTLVMLAFAVWLFGERLTPGRMLGALLVIVGLVLVKRSP